MSKIGKKIINIPEGVTVEITDHKIGQEIVVTGPKGSLTQQVLKGILVKKENNSLKLTISRPNQNALQGLFRSLLNNNIFGVTSGWNKGLEMKGVGYRASVSDKKLILTIGFSHPVEYPIPAGINIVVVENKINVSGIDKQQVGQSAAKIRSFRPPEPYKGKGIHYIGEKIRKKAGKQAAKVTGGAS